LSPPGQKRPLGCVKEAERTKTTMELLEQGAVRVPFAAGNWAVVRSKFTPEKRGLERRPVAMK